MTIDHRRPLIAFIGVSVLCAFVMVNGFLLVARSPVGSDLASARGLFSGFEGAEQPQLMPEVVDGATVVEEPGVEAPGGTTTEAQVLAIDALRDAARTAADPAGDAAGTGATGADGAGTDATGTGRSGEPRTSGPDNERDTTARTRDRSISGQDSSDGQQGGDVRGRPGTGTASPEPDTDGPASEEPAVSTDKPGKSGQARGRAAKAPKADKPAKADKAPKPAKPAKAPQSDKAPKAPKADKPAKADKAPKADKPAKAPKTPKADKPGKGPKADKSSGHAKGHDKSSAGKGKATSHAKASGRR